MPSTTRWPPTSGSRWSSRRRGTPHRSKRSTIRVSCDSSNARGATTRSAIPAHTTSSPTSSPCRAWSPVSVSSPRGQSSTTNSAAGASRPRRRSPRARTTQRVPLSTLRSPRPMRSWPVRRRPTACVDHPAITRRPACTAATASSTTRRLRPTTSRRPPARRSPCSTSTTTMATGPSRSSTAATTSSTSRCTAIPLGPIRMSPGSPTNAVRDAGPEPT